MPRGIVPFSHVWAGNTGTLLLIWVTCVTTKKLRKTRRVTNDVMSRHNIIHGTLPYSPIVM